MKSSTFRTTNKDQSMRNVEHIGIAVKDLGKADALFTLLFGRKPYKHESVEREGVTTSFYQVGNTKIELLEASRGESAIAKYLEKNREGMHHIAFDVEDIRAEMQRLKAAGFELLQEEPLPGADDKLVCFLHPKSTGGVLVELCMERKKDSSA